MPRELGRYAGLGMQFGCSFMVFFGAGFWLDRWLGTRPWFTLVGLAVGATASMWWLIRQVPAAGSSRAARRGPAREDDATP